MKKAEEPRRNRRKKKTQNQEIGKKNCGTQLLSNP